MYVDSSGHAWYHLDIGVGIIATCAILAITTAGAVIGGA